MILKVLAMMVLSFSMMLLSFSMSTQAQEMTADTLSAAQDSISKSLMLQEVKVTIPTKTWMNDAERGENGCRIIP